MESSACSAAKTFWNSVLWPAHRRPQGFAHLYRSGAPARIRTSDPQIRSLVLYPAELRARAAVGPKTAAGMIFEITASGTSSHKAR